MATRSSPRLTAAEFRTRMVKDSPLLEDVYDAINDAALDEKYEAELELSPEDYTSEMIEAVQVYLLGKGFNINCEFATLHVSWAK